MEQEKEFISLSEAARLASVSSMTIRRFAKKLQASDNPDDTASVKVLFDKNPYGKKYYVTKDKVMSEFRVTGVASHVNDTVITTGSEGVTSLLNESIAVLKGELDKKNDTIKRLIGELGEYRKAQTESAKANRLTRLLQYPAEKIELVRRLVSGETTAPEKKKADYVEADFTQAEFGETQEVIDADSQPEPGSNSEDAHFSQGTHP